ncbi:MAG: hypothetical protein P4N41_20175 [Negativicutes bacterium]|nr:hypothetical protein [Negativicutes bacterium]
MTHSLHRRGTKESLEKDYVLLVTAAAEVNHWGSQEKLRKILDVVWEVGPANIGSYYAGTILAGYSIDQIRASLNDIPRVRCSFSSREKIEEVIRRLQEMDLGMSVTIEGPTKDVEEISQGLGIKPHSVNLSLDIWGKTEELPPEEILEFVTMCGHGMVSQHAVKKAIEDVKSGKKTPEQAAVTIGRPCVCGIFNPDRAVDLLRKYVPAN